MKTRNKVFAGNPNTIVQFRNCRILFNGEIIREDFWVRNGKILNPEKLFYLERKKADVQFDCGNLIISAGFIDVQINGKFHVAVTAEYFLCVFQCFSSLDHVQEELVNF